MAFRRAAEDALVRVPCWGEGAVYRAVAALQHQYFNPPPDRETNRPLGLGSRHSSLKLNGYQVYLPRVRERRISHGRKIEVRPPLFPGYCFLTVVSGWWSARWTAGVLGLIMSGTHQPARVPDSVIDEIRARSSCPSARRFAPARLCASREGRLTVTTASTLVSGHTSACWSSWRCSAVSSGSSLPRVISRRCEDCPLLVPNPNTWVQRTS